MKKKILVTLLFTAFNCTSVILATNNDDNNNEKSTQINAESNKKKNIKPEVLEEIMKNIEEEIQNDNSNISKLWQLLREEHKEYSSRLLQNIAKQAPAAIKAVIEKILSNEEKETHESSDGDNSGDKSDKINSSTNETLSTFLNSQSKNQ